MTSNKNNFPIGILIIFSILGIRNCTSQRQQPNRINTPPIPQRTVPYTQTPRTNSPTPSEMMDWVIQMQNPPKLQRTPIQQQQPGIPLNPLPTRCTQQWVGNQWVTQCN